MSLPNHTCRLAQAPKQSYLKGTYDLTIYADNLKYKALSLGYPEQDLLTGTNLTRDGKNVWQDMTHFILQKGANEIIDLEIKSGDVIVSADGQIIRFSIK